MRYAEYEKNFPRLSIRMIIVREDEHEERVVYDYVQNILFAKQHFPYIYRRREKFQFVIFTKKKITYSFGTVQSQFQFFVEFPS